MIYRSPKKKMNDIMKYDKNKNKRLYNQKAQVVHAFIF